MHALSQWVTQIVLIIMFAMILELLLPHDRFNRYVKTVIGLILILTLLSPIMSLFHKPVDSILNQLMPPSTSDPIKNSLNVNKKEIVSGQSAYISKQMAVQMKSYVKGELSNRYGLVIQSLDLQLDQSHPNVPIEHADVTLEKTRSSTSASSSSKTNQMSVSPVKKVQVASVSVSPIGNQQTATSTTSNSFPNEKAVKSFLATQWNLPADQITLHLKGGGT